MPPADLDGEPAVVAVADANSDAAGVLLSLTVSATAAVLVVDVLAVPVAPPEVVLALAPAPV